MNNKESNIEKTNFDAFIQAVGSEIEQAQVRLIVAANAQMLFHYWKVGNYILYHQQLHGWGSKIIKQLAKAIRLHYPEKKGAANAQMLFHYWKVGNYILYHQQLHGWGSKIIKQLAKAIRLHYPEKKGYSERNLTYMCQFAKAYPLRALQSFIETDARLIAPNVKKIEDEVHFLNDFQFTQEPLAQIQSTDNKEMIITQEPLAQIHNVTKTVSDIYQMEIKNIESVFMTSPVARINWASHVIMLNSSLPLGLSYWYMKQSVEMGWSSNVLKLQIDSDLYSRQISNNKVNNFTTTLPAPAPSHFYGLLRVPVA